MAKEYQLEANRRWKAKAAENLTIQLRKGTRESWKEAAARHGLSLSRLVQDGVAEKIAALDAAKA